MILTVADRLRLPHLNNGLQKILDTYTAPNSTHAASPTWVEHFSRGVEPVRCHSHNDYWHRIPLYEGLAAGCVSTEADIWIGTTTSGEADLFVGHKANSLSPSRTLRSLYLDPLADILRMQGIASHDSRTQIYTQNAGDASFPGIFSTSPNTSLVLLLDFKTKYNATWDAVVIQLDRFRKNGWLTYWTPTESLVVRPLTIVASGDAPFAPIIANTTYRDIFYDAPLTELSKLDSHYNSNNSYYASSSIRNAIGNVHFGKLTPKQKAKVVEQVQKATEVGLRSRYWAAPSWPVGWRNRIWGELVESGASILSADDLTAAARWDWNMCVVGGLNICNS